MTLSYGPIMREAPRASRWDEIPRSLVIRLLLVAVAVLTLAASVVLYLRYGREVDQIMGLGPLLDSTRENNIPTWFSSSSMLLCALVLGSIVLRLRERAPRESRWWLGLAVLFCLGSVDETANLHESLSQLGKRLVAGEEPGLLVRPWVLFLGPLAIAVTAVYARFFTGQPRDVRRSFALGAALFLGGALGLELVEVALGPTQLQRPPMLATMVAQEALEMFGVVAFLNGALLRHERLGPTGPGGGAPEAADAGREPAAPAAP